MKTVLRFSVVLLLISSVAGPALANKACQAYDDFYIMVSPNTLILKSSCDMITIHSNIPYSAVDTTSVAINGVSVATWSDDCGDLVARIAVDVLAPEPGQMTLTLSGVLIDGTGFSVDGLITVK